MNYKQIINDKKTEKLLRLIQYLYPIGTIIEINGVYITRYADINQKYTNTNINELSYALIIETPKKFVGINYHGVYVKVLINDLIKELILIHPRQYQFGKKILNKEIYEMKKKFKIV